MKYSQHPLSAAFPAMPDEEFGALVEDIRQHGQRDVATLRDGMVIDGWHRYQACEELGIPCRFEEFEGNDPVAFVCSKNLHRRQLTASQRAAAVVAANAWKPPHREKKGDGPSPLSATNSQMADTAGVDARTVQRAKRAHEAGLGDAVRDGKVSAEKAAAIAQLPKDEQSTAMEHPEEFEIKPKNPAPPKLTVIGGGKDAAELDAVREQLAAMTAERDELSDRLSEMADDLAGYMKACEGNDEAAREIKRLLGQLHTVERQRDEQMSKCAEMLKQIKMLERQLRRAGKGAA